MFTSVFTSYGVSPYLFKLGADGKIVYGGITEETRSALKLLNKWYKGGLIDPEFLTTDNNQLNEKFANQKIGMVDNMGWGSFAKTSGFIAKPGLEKGQNVIAGKPVIGPAGKAYAFSGGPRQAPVLLGVQLEKDGRNGPRFSKFLIALQQMMMLAVDGVRSKGPQLRSGWRLCHCKNGTGGRCDKSRRRQLYNPLNAVDTTKNKYTTSKELLDLKAKVDTGYEPLRAFWDLLFDHQGRNMGRIYIQF